MDSSYSDVFHILPFSKISAFDFTQGEDLQVFDHHVNFCIIYTHIYRSSYILSVKICNFIISSMRVYVTLLLVIDGQIHIKIWMVWNVCKYVLIH